MWNPLDVRVQVPATNNQQRVGVVQDKDTLQGHLYACSNGLSLSPHMHPLYGEQDGSMRSLVRVPAFKEIPRGIRSFLE